MLAVIDETAKPQLPQIYLAKPNRNIIGKLNHFIYLPHQHDFNLGSLNEMTFKMPYEVENPFEHKLERNPFIDVILERYLLKIKLGADEEWYVINEIEDDMDSEKDTKTIHAYSLGYEINDKLIRDYEVVSYSLEEVATDALRYTLWSVGEIDEKFKDKRRSFEVSEKTALSFLEEIAEKFGALIEYDTVNRRVHFRDPAKTGTYRGLNINYGKYLKSLGKNSKADEMVTRLYVYGENGMSINRVNPTGMPYIEDFSYFMYPFEMDENGKVIKHSQYMSDELCKAIIKYDELVKSKEGVFASLIDEMEYWQLKLMEVESELFLLETELKIIQERLDIQRSYGSFLYHENTYNNDSETIEFDLNRSSKSAIFARTDNSNLTINIDGITIPQTPINEWKVLRRISEQEITRIRINGTGTIQLYIVEITDEDYELSDQYIIDKYCEHKQQEEVNMVQAQWDEYNTELTIIENEIYDLKEELSIENNFSPKLIQERNQFIIEKTWQDNSYFDDKELFEDAKEKFTELKMPKTSIDIDIVNFKEILEEQHNWNRLALGDEIRIEYDVMNVNIQAKVIKITYNYQNKTIRLRIANIKEIEGKNAKLLEMLKSSYSTSTSVDMSKYKWDETTRKTNEVARLMDQEYDATQRRIIAGANETVTIDNRGITIKNPDFPNEIIRMNSGVLALSKSDGQNWETAITPNGVVAEKLYGNLIAGQNLKITNEKGSFVFDENGLNIKYNDLIVVDEDGQNKFEKIDNNIKALSEHVNKEIDDLNKSISDLDNYIEDVFRDSIIQETEAKTIKTYLMDLEKEKLDLDAKYNEIYNNPLLSGTTEKSQLNSSKNNYNSRFNNLVSVINNVIADGKVTESERILVDTAFELYKQAVADLTVKLEQATNKIQFLLDEKINTKVDFEVYESKTSELTNNINGITANVSSLTTKVNNNEVQITDLQSNFNILADQISSKVEKSEFDSVTNSLGNRISTIEQTADSISLEVSDIKENVYTKSEVDSAIDNLQIGGRNLLRNTSDKNKTVTWSYWDYPLLDVPRIEDVGLSVGDTVVFRVYIEETNAPVKAFVQFLLYDGSKIRYRQKDGNIIDEGESGWSEVKFTISEEDVNGLQIFRVAIRNTNNSNATVTYRKAKMEIGNKATDWTPAPEDIDEKFTDIEGTLESHNTKIEQNAQQIQLRATKAEVDTLSGRINQAESQITQLAGQVSTKAEASTVTALDNRVTTAEQNISALQGEITQKVSQSTFNVLENRVTQAESTITQTANNVTFAFNRIDSIDGVLNSAVTTIDASGVTVKDGSFFLEDDTVDTKYSLVSKTNHIYDHSFELLKRIEGSINPTYGDFDFVDGNTFNSWKKVGNPRLLSFYRTDFAEAGQIIFGNQAVVVNSSNYVRQSIGWWEGVTYTLSAYYTVYNRSSSGYPRLRVRIVDEANNTKRILATKDFPKVTAGMSSRVSLTFTIPDGLHEEDSVLVELLTTNASYLVVDGVQLVEGMHPTLYEPETSLFEFMTSVNGYELSRLHFKKDSYRSDLEGLYMNNSDIIGVNALYFNDPGNSEGIIWEGGNGWRIVEAPDNMTNAQGNLQFATNNTRRMTVETDGTLNVTNHITGNDKRWRATVDQNYGYIQTVRGEMRVTKYSSTTLIPIRASSHPTGSSILTKQNIEELNVEDAYFLLNNADVYTYHINSNIDDGIFDKKKIGMISEMVPSLLRDEDGIDTYSIISALWKVVQNEVKLRKKNEKNLEDLMIVMDEIIKENKYLMSKLEQMEAKSS